DWRVGSIAVTLRGDCTHVGQVGNLPPRYSEGVILKVGIRLNELGGVWAKLEKGFDNSGAGQAIALHLGSDEGFHPGSGVEDVFDDWGEFIEASGWIVRAIR